MQIIGLHKNLYKFYAYSRSQECLDEYQKKYEEGVRRWASQNPRVFVTKSARNSLVSVVSDLPSKRPFHAFPSSIY